MKILIFLLACVAVAVTATAAESSVAHGGTWAEAMPKDHITAEQRSQIKSMLDSNVQRLTRESRLDEQRSGAM